MRKITTLLAMCTTVGCTAAQKQKIQDALTKKGPKLSCKACAAINSLCKARGILDDKIEHTKETDVQLTVEKEDKPEK